MIFYSRENGRDGERDYLNTDDFKDVFFEEDSFNCISNVGNKIEVSYALAYTEGSEIIEFKASTALNGEKIEKVYEITEPYLLVEQGAEAYYNEIMLDEIELIKTAKTQLLNEIKEEIASRDVILLGTSIDTMALLVNGGNTIAVFDNITINSNTEITAEKFYSILDVGTITAGTLSIYISDAKAYVGEIDNITVKDSTSAIVKFSTSSIVETEVPEFVKPSQLTNREFYDENRVKFISVESSTEQIYDEFDDLF